MGLGGSFISSHDQLPKERLLLLLLLSKRVVLNQHKTTLTTDTDGLFLNNTVEMSFI